MIKSKQKIERIFKNVTSHKNIHEGILFIESKNGEFKFSKGYGGKTIDTPIVIASITKLFTTVCIIKLIENKKLSLNNKVSDYLNNEYLNSLHIYKCHDYSFDLTIYDLLFQTSGLPDIYETKNNSLKSRAIEKDIYVSFKEIINEVKLLPPRFAPGKHNKKAYYADVNFDILGVIIEKVLSVPLAQAFFDFIIEPLNLKNTYLPVSEKDLVPYIYYNDMALYRPNFIKSCYSSGGCISTVNDLMIFIKSFFTGKLFNQTLFTELSTYRNLQLSMYPIRYGGGYMQIELGGISTLFLGNGELLGHSGSTGSFAFYYPDKELFFVGDFNQISDASIPIRFVMKLAMFI